MKSVKEVEVDCVIFFYQKGKCDDNYVSRERSRLKLKKKQDIAEVKREIRGVVSPPCCKIISWKKSAFLFIWFLDSVINIFLANF